MLAALGQEARLEIFRLLVRAGAGGRCVEEIRDEVEIPGSTLSHHLDTLTRCGLLSARRDGRFIHYAVDWAQATALLRFLVEDCCARQGDCATASPPAKRLNPSTARQTKRRRR